LAVADVYHADDFSGLDASGKSPAIARAALRDLQRRFNPHFSRVRVLPPFASDVLVSDEVLAGSGRGFSAAPVSHALVQLIAFSFRS
jgi:hypothetical protein